MRPTLLPGCALAIVVMTSPFRAQSQEAVTLRLGDLHREAERVDRRAAQLELLTAQSRLRLESIRAERLPAVNLLGMAQYLSDVPSLPGGAGPAPPPNDNYDAHVALRQRLFDPSVAPRRAVERAQLAEGEARLRTTLFAQRQAVNESFFAALSLDLQRRAIETTVTDLEAQRTLAARRVSEGAALPSEVATLDAELLRRRQAASTLASERDAAREVLGSLIGRAVGAGDVLALPDAAEAETDADVAALGRAPRSGAGAADGARLEELAAGRPEYRQFARSRELAAERRDALLAQDRPRVGAFARAGYGRPGLNPLARDFDSYWLAGVQLEWAPWNWGGTQREREVLALQADIIASEEAAFTATIERTVTRARASVRQLRATLAADSAILGLQRGIYEETRTRFAEGVITSAELVDRQTDVLGAELALITHRVQLADAQVRLLTTLGREIR